MQSKKQLFELFSSIAHLNDTAWGNHAGSYDDATEAAYQIEEALEGFTNLPNLAKQIMVEDSITGYNAYTPKDISRGIVALAIVDAINEDGNRTPIPDVDRFDKALDSIFFAVGSLHKLGLTPHQMVDGLQIVHAANLQKQGTKDSEGKVIKNADRKSVV